MFATTQQPEAADTSWAPIKAGGGRPLMETAHKTGTELTSVVVELLMRAQLHNQLVDAQCSESTFFTNSEADDCGYEHRQATTTVPFCG